MKRIRILTLTLIMLFTFAACGGKPGASADATQDSGPGSPNAAGTSENSGGGSSSQSATSSGTTVSFAQEGDITVITVISPYVSQFTEEALKLPQEDIYQASFGVYFNNRDDWEQGFGVSLGLQHTTIYSGDQEIASYISDGRFNEFGSQLHLSTYEGGLALKVDGDKAEWVISGVDISLDNITDVQINAGLVNNISNPDDYLFFESIPLEQVAVSDTVPVADVSELPFDITGTYVQWYVEEGGMVLVEAVPGGYVMTCKDYVSPIMQPYSIFEEDMSDRIEFSTQGVDGVRVIFEKEKEDPDSPHDPYDNDFYNLSASFDFGSMPDGSNLSMNSCYKVHLLPGTFMSYDFSEGTSKPMVSYEMQDGKFRFRLYTGLIDEEYETDWLAPIGSNGNLDFAFDINGTEVGVRLTAQDVPGYYIIAEVSIGGGAWRSYLRENEELLSSIDLSGTYKTTSSSGEEFVMTIADGNVSCSGEFEGTGTAADLFNSSWEPFTLTYGATGEKVLGMWSYYMFQQGSDGKFVPGDSITLEVYEDTPGGRNLGYFYMTKE